MKTLDASRAFLHMNRQEYYRQEYRKKHPAWQDSLKLYIQEVDKLVDANTRVLDIGCGHGDFLKEVYARTPHVYGIDPDAEALKKNTIIKHPQVGTAESLPYESGTFDLVVCAWVLEHVDRPGVFWHEVFRVLKPGGTVVFLTPNAWNYVVLINLLIPHRFHDFLTRKLYDRQEHDTYPVRYRCNSVREFHVHLKDAGFISWKLRMNGDPSYISFNRPLFWLACAIEWVLSWSFLEAYRVHFIGIVKKGNA